MKTKYVMIKRVLFIIEKKYILLLMTMFPLFVFSQVGINTIDPQASLDIKGNLRIQDVPMSTSTNEAILVVDDSGYVKKSLVDVSTFRGYLNQDFVSGTDVAAIYRITNFNILENSLNDFNATTSQFTAPITGFYSIRMNVTSKRSGDTTKKNVVYGLVENLGTATHQWVMRFSIPFTYIDGIGSTSNAGVANSFIGIVELKKGSQYYFGVTSDVTVLANPSGTTGSGIGTFFEIQLVKSE